MDMQYQYTEKYVKDIAESIRFIAGSDDTYSIKEMPAAITAANPPMLDKPEDLFATQFNAQLGTANQCFRWGIFSKYADDSYLVTMDGYQSSSSSAVIRRGMLFDETFTTFNPYLRFYCDSYNNIYFTRQENNTASGVYLDSNGVPHIPKDLPFVMPTRNFAGWNSNQGRWYPSWMGSGTYNEPASLYSYIKDYNAIDTAIFGGRFKVFGASNLNGRIPSEIYSVINDEAWHTKSDLSSDINILSFINRPTVPSGETIVAAHWFNLLGYNSDDVLKYNNYHCGPSILYFKDLGDRWIFDTRTIGTDNRLASFYNTNGNNLLAYYSHWRHAGLDGYGVYPWNDGANKEDVNFSSYRESKTDLIGWNHYSVPKSVDDLESYIPWRTYDIKDQNGNVLLPANATLADFGIS